MKGKLLYPYSDSLLQYEFKEDHPLNPDRLKLTYLLSNELGLLKDVEILEPEMATRSELERFHTSEYIDAVLEVAKTQEPRYRFGLGTMDNPLFPNIYDAAARYVGATLVAVKRMLQGPTHAFCISGGLHHSHQSQASGFCIFNDIVASIMLAQEQKPMRVLYYDFDAHHGDGVQNAFYHSKDVLTISIHQTGKTLFPGTGEVYESGAGDAVGYSVNIPLNPGAGSVELSRAFDEVVEPLFHSYQPDLLVTQLGVDAHFADPLANLTMTTHGFEYVLKKLHKLSDKYCKSGWLALGGGGYNPVNVARLWSLFLAIILKKKIADKIPESFIEIADSMGHSVDFKSMRDDTEVIQEYMPREQIMVDLDRVIRRIKEEIFPYHGI